MERLSTSEKGALAEPIVKASRYIEDTAAGGGTRQAYRSFQHSDRSGNRVDMIINGKINIIPD